MHQIFGQIIYGFIGYLYLWVRYRNHEKVLQIKEENYDDQYSVAGAQLVMSIIGIIFISALLFMLICVIYIAITKPELASVK